MTASARSGTKRASPPPNSIAPERAARVIPVRGCLLTPGLIDIHVHGFRSVSHAGVELGFGLAADDRGQVEHAGGVGRERCVDHRAVGDVAGDDADARVVEARGGDDVEQDDFGDGPCLAAGIGQRAAREQGMGEATAEKAGAAGDDDSHGSAPQIRVRSKYGCRGSRARRAIGPVCREFPGHLPNHHWHRLPTPSTKRSIGALRIGRHDGNSESAYARGLRFPADQNST